MTRSYDLACRQIYTIAILGVTGFRKLHVLMFAGSGPIISRLDSQLKLVSDVYTQFSVRRIGGPRK